ncbi:DUF4249 domain-containing protein [Flavobacterium granuli]|uniref:DUF4249 domain-containing protein n=1 Tax=Flavobacterium granuli TaxID=280093 RepID=A0ABU1RZ06_9FLAO|nr:DUF4249 domain-containing protein [Flavobacterium granuli]MDR6844008.1 hypothetical protein [Flavobacterium granuli]
MPLNKTILLLLICFIINGCTEPYILETNTYEEALVVEATITNEFKKQEIILTKTAKLEDKEIKVESGAEIYITDNTGNHYDFEEDSGKYVSTTEFQAIPEREYKLSINTKDGRSFESSIEKLAPINPIQDLKAFVETKEDSIRGVAIHVYNYDPTENAKYYRYKFEETYKIVAPFWTTQKATVVPGPPTAIQLIRNTVDTRVCYGTKNSTDFILTSTTELNENRLDFIVRFISDQNYILSHRYSILVYQYVENLAAYTYYKTLKKLSDSGTLLSPLQPGFFYGNIQSTTNPDNKVIGFFDVSSVTSKRMFFNYIDLFPNESLPPYYTECEELKMKFCDGPVDCNADELIYGFTTNTLTYYRNLDNQYTVYKAPCGDCTTFASGVKPPFWID